MKAQHLQRSIDPPLDRLLATVPAFASDGPNGVGKTETCSRRRELFSLDPHYNEPEPWQILAWQHGY